jgi:hypothetical protein
MSDMKRREFMILLGVAAACRSRRARWPVCAANLPNSQLQRGWATGLWGQTCIGGEAGRDPPAFSPHRARRPARFDFERVHGRDDHIDGPPFNLGPMTCGPLTNVCYWIVKIKIPTTREFFARVFDLSTVRLDGQ